MTPTRSKSSSEPPLLIAGGLTPRVAKRTLPSLGKAMEIIDYVQGRPWREGWQVTRPVADIAAMKAMAPYGLEVYRVTCVWPTDDSRMEEELVFWYEDQFLSMPVTTPPVPTRKRQKERA